MSKIVILGCGGEWTKSIVSDISLTSSLHGSEITLVDINETNLRVAERLAHRISNQTGANLKISGTTERKEALKGANFILIGISVGGYESWAQDIQIPWERFKIKQTVGDTMGPGGIFRALRHIPVILEIAKDVKEICPDAWVIQLTNPMTPICRAIEKETDINILGYCHGVDNTEEYLAEYLEIDSKRLKIYGYGVNHFLFIKSLWIDGKNGMDQLNKISDKIKDKQPSIYELWKTYGIYPINRHFHPCEFVPFFLNSRTNYGDDYKLDQFIPNYMINRSRNIVSDLERELSSGQDLPISRSREYITNIMESMILNQDFVVHINVRNNGAISNLPLYCNVEVPALINNRGFHPLVMGGLPIGIDSLVRRVVDEQEMMVEAALTGSRDLAVRALASDPLINDIQLANGIFDAMFEAQKRYLPQFA